MLVTIEACHLREEIPGKTKEPGKRTVAGSSSQHCHERRSLVGWFPTTSNPERPFSSQTVVSSARYREAGENRTYTALDNLTGLTLINCHPHPGSSAQSRKSLLIFSRCRVSRFCIRNLANTPGAKSIISVIRSYCHCGKNA